MLVSVTTIFQNHGLKSLHDSKLRVAANTNVGAARQRSALLAIHIRVEAKLPLSFQPGC